MKERIRSIMQYMRLSQQDFANRLGISAASLSSIFTGRTNPTNNHVMAIHHAFPEININWLLFGEGEMILSPKSDDQDADVLDADVAATAPTGGADGTSQVVQPGSLFDQSLVAVGQPPVSGSQSPLPGSQPLHADPYSSHGQWRETAGYPKRGSEMIGNAINIDKRTRKIKEIRVFFDDGTYESFVPSGK